jgi:hypothetical protein
VSLPRSLRSCHPDPGVQRGLLPHTPEPGMHSSSLRSPPPGVVRGQSVLSYHKAKNRTKAATLPGLGTVGVRGPNPQNRTDTSWGQLAKPPCEREDGYIIHSQLARWPGALTLHPNSQSAQPPCLWPVYPCHKNCALPSPLQREFRQHRGVEFAFSLSHWIHRSVVPRRPEWRDRHVCLGPWVPASFFP